MRIYFLTQYDFLADRIFRLYASNDTMPTLEYTPAQRQCVRIKVEPLSLQSQSMV